MQFFKVSGLIAEDNRVKEHGRRGMRRQKTRDLVLRTGTWNRKFRNKNFIYIIDISEDVITMGVIWCELTHFNEQLLSYLNALELILDDVHTEEVTLNDVHDFLMSANRKGYINSYHDVVERFDLDAVFHRFYRDFDYSEGFIETIDESTAYQETDRFSTGKSLRLELDRIYYGKSTQKVVGHPVHYIVETDNDDTCESVCKILLSSLYANSRLLSRRYYFLRYEFDDDISLKSYDSFYKSIVGGAVIVKYLVHNDKEDHDVSVDREEVEKFCKMVQKYHHRVLTIFCFSHKCTKLKNLFFEYLGDICFVEVKEEAVSGEQAKNRLKMFAEDEGVETDKNLFAKLDDKAEYLASELYTMFEHWYDGKLKTDIYPQYKDFISIKKEAVKVKPTGSAYDELMQMIGLSEVKKIINQMLTYHKAQRILGDFEKQKTKPAMHMVFTGNPGTAKTSVARLLAKIMKENHLLSNGNLVEVGRGDLIGKYVGWTAPGIQNKFSEARGGVLFIDEAYALLDDRTGSFGDEAIDTIVQEMENHREDMMVIFAGYPDKMEEFLQRNPGLRSRIAFHVSFNDYNTEELCDIANLIAGKQGLKLTNKAQQKLADIFDVAKNEKDFGNGRYVRNVIERAKMAQACRLLSMDSDDISKNDIATICDEDIEDVSITLREEKKQIGFTKNPL